MTDSDDDWDFDMSSWKPAAGPQFSNYDPETIIKELKQHPFFATELSGGNNDMMDAMQQLLYDGTPLEIATNFKNQGNQAFEEKRYRDALQFYTSGIQINCDDVDLESILLSNRAATQLQLQNYREAWNDAMASSTLKPNVKAYFRAAKASMAVEKLDKALQVLNKALELDPSNETIKTEIEKCNDEINALKEKEAKEKAQRLAKERERKIIDKALKVRKIKTISTHENKEELQKSHPLTGIVQTPLDSPIFIDKETGNLVIPTLFLYPQHQTSDFIQEFNEGHEFGDHLGYMFADDAPAIDWDKDKEYKPNNLEVWYEDVRDATSLRRVNLDWTLGDVARHESFAIRDGVAVFFVIPKTGRWSKEFKERYKKLVNE